MGTTKKHRSLSLLTLLYLTVSEVQCAVRELTETKPALYRNAREDRFYQSRYGSTGQQSTTNRSLKPDERPEARNHETGTGVEKRCIRCTGYDPYDTRYDYDRDYDRNRYYDRYDDNRYDYRTYDRYDRYDRPYNDRDRWYDRRDYDRYDRGYDRYDRDRYDKYDRYDSNRGFGYDNRGYDYRDYRAGGYDNRRDYRGGYRPYEDSGRYWDNYGRNYFPSGGGGRHEPNYWGGGYDRGYASSWTYGRGADGYRDTNYRPRDPYYDQGFYRGTSYLYDRNPSPTTARTPPSKDNDQGVTDRPGVNNKPSDSSSSG